MLSKFSALPTSDNKPLTVLGVRNGMIWSIMPLMSIFFSALSKGLIASTRPERSRPSSSSRIGSMISKRLSRSTLFRTSISGTAPEMRVWV